MLNNGIIVVIRRICGHSSFKILICVGFLSQREFQNKSKLQSGQSMHKRCPSTVYEQRDFCKPITPRTGSKSRMEDFDDCSNCI